MVAGADERASHHVLHTENRPLFAASGPFGAVSSVHPVKTDGWLPASCSIYTASTGNTSAVVGSFRDDSHVSYGTGRAYNNPPLARMLAIIEALERYASMVTDDRAFFYASASELGDDAMDLDLVARCSEREMRHPSCVLRTADKTKRIRWIAGVDLHSGKETLVPAVMVYLGLSREPAEYFWTPITTGCAAHTTIEAALVNAICEVIERDAIAMTWLQRLPLPRLADDCLPEQVREIIQWCTARDASIHLFDATTDVGVPTVYCVQTTRTGDHAAQLVSCASDFDVRAAVLRATLEVIGLRAAIHARGPTPRRYADYTSVLDGAAVMARRKRRHAFGFLLDSPESRPASRPESAVIASPSERLRFLVRRLADLGMSVFATDISTRELDEVGLAAARVIIPQLQPMSLKPRAQYRGHPRLYSGPASMGMRVLPESRLNPYPQPVA
jgi:ribosomal protein S12 methylthiotransferase accessory factor